jgi:hypothetical protein
MVVALAVIRLRFLRPIGGGCVALGQRLGAGTGHP